MKTTSLFIEILIIGGEAFTLGVLLLMCITDVPPDKVTTVLSNPLLWVPGLVFCYILGIVLDNRIHEMFFRSGQRRIRANIIREREKNEELSDDECRDRWREVRKAGLAMPTSVMGAVHLPYIRHRIRILRGSAGNIPLIAVLGSVVIVKFRYHLAYVGLALLFGAALTCACYVVWKRIEDSWSTLSYDWYVFSSEQKKERG